MCRWYYIDVLKHQQLKKIVHDFHGNIQPGNLAPVILKENGYKMVLMTWGYPIQDHYIYNARCETVMEKSFFKSIYTHRCLVPASGYYEWNKKKERYANELDKPFYFAGIYHNNHFTIITTPANRYVKHIHHRMPLILQGDDIRVWLSKDYQKLLQINEIELKTIKDDEKYCWKQGKLF